MTWQTDHQRMREYYTRHSGPKQRPDAIDIMCIWLTLSASVWLVLRPHPAAALWLGFLAMLLTWWSYRLLKALAWLVIVGPRR